jgi:hypothetical protein
VPALPSNLGVIPAASAPDVFTRRVLLPATLMLPIDMPAVRIRIY